MVLGRRPPVATLVASVMLLALVAACGHDNSEPASPTAAGTPTPAASKLPIPDPWELHVAAADGSGDEKLIASDRPFSFALSPDGSEVALSAGTYTATTVRFLGLDGHERARSSHDGFSGGLDWSPDGRYLATVFTVGTTDMLTAVRTADGSQKELLKGSSSTPLTTSGWLPDGELLVEKSKSGGSGADLIAVNVDAGTSRPLSSLNVWRTLDPPAVSPDGKRLALWAASSGFGCGQGGTAVGVWSIDLATAVTSRLLPQTYCAGGGIAWSPDGTQVAFSVLDWVAASSALYAADLTARQPRRLATGLVNAVAWLGDGTIVADRLACVNCESAGLPSVVAISSATGEERQVIGNVPSAIGRSGRVVAADGAIKTIDLKGQPLATLAPVEDGWQYRSFTWSADETRVAYISSHAEGTRFFEVGRDGSAFRQTGYTAQGNVQLSPNGSRMAYLVYTPETTGKASATLWLSDPDGANASSVANGVVAGLSWSPDGGRLLFSDADKASTTGALYVVNADGSGVRKVAATGGTAAGIWAPNGRLVVFPGAPMTVVDVDSGSVTTVSPGAQKGFPAWSADSSKLIYPVSNGQNGTDLFESSVDGSGSTRIKGDTSFKSNLAASPDGSKIAYVSFAGGNSELVVANADGSGPAVVLKGPSLGDVGPAWSPDGQWLAVIAAAGDSSGLFAVRADGSQTTQLTQGSTFTAISWSGNDRIRFATFTGHD